MSELIGTRDNRATIRWKLLTSASALALTVYASAAKAEDADRPLIWLELGGQMETIGGQGEVFAPPFLAANPDSPVLQKVTPLQAQKLPKFNFGEDGKISFQPEGSDWVFSAALRYGRSVNSRHVDHQTHGVYYKYYTANGAGKNAAPCTPCTAADFADTKAHHSESHAILDFQVGKDVGLGMFGKDSSSVLSFAVRFAQFTSNATFDIRARPDLQFKYLPISSGSAHFKLPYFNTYHATGHASRSFRGVGPSLSWNGSAPFAGSRQDGELEVDWGVNAGILFGKQKARARHQEIAHYNSPTAIFVGRFYPTAYPTRYNHSTRSRSITVPNVGGSIGLSWRVQDFKVSMGYRADVFFGAMDTGINAVKNSNATFNGPYASISIGLGD